MIRVGESARDLGVITDSKLSLSARVVALCWAGFYHLCQLRPVLRSLTHEAAKTLVQAFISSRLDYCNSLLYSVSNSLIRKVQSIQNAAARLLVRTRQHEHISPVLRQLHWLPCPETYQLQIGTLCLLISVRLHNSVLGWWYRFGFWRTQMAATLFRQQIAFCSMHTQHIWW